MSNYFDSFCNEGNTYINQLAGKLGHPDRKEKAIHLLKGTLHALRDRITVSESLHVLAQLPLFLKALYVDQWAYHPKPPLHYKTVEEYVDQVKDYTKHYGEQAFGRDEDIENLVKMVISDLRDRYLSEGMIHHIMCQLPKEVQDIFTNTRYQL